MNVPSVPVSLFPCFPVPVASRFYVGRTRVSLLPSNTRSRRATLPLMSQQGLGLMWATRMMMSHIHHSLPTTCGHVVAAAIMIRLRILPATSTSMAADAGSLPVLASTAVQIVSSVPRRSVPATRAAIFTQPSREQDQTYAYAYVLVPASSGPQTSFSSHRPPPRTTAPLSTPPRRAGTTC
jgi:hypothetical protein